MKNNLNNLVKKKQRKSVFFPNKKFINNLNFQKKTKKIKTPPGFKRRRTRVLNSERYISNLLKKQLIYDNSYLFPNKEKPKIYKNIPVVISLIPEEEKGNIIIEDIKGKFDNKNKKININEFNKKNIVNKVDEEISKDEDDSFSSFRKSNKFSKRKKSRFSIKNGVLNKFMLNKEEKEEVNVEENEKDKKERLLMEKLYNFFGKIQKLKNSNDNEVDEFINEDLEKKGFNERRQKFLRINSFIDDINYMKYYDRIIKQKIKYLSPLCFSSPSIIKK